MRANEETIGLGPTVPKESLARLREHGGITCVLAHRIDIYPVWEPVDRRVGACAQSPRMCLFVIVLPIVLLVIQTLALIILLA